MFDDKHTHFVFARLFNGIADMILLTSELETGVKLSLSWIHALRGSCCLNELRTKNCGLEKHHDLVLLLRLLRGAISFNFFIGTIL